MPKIDLARVPERRGSSYPAPFAEAVGARIKQALGDAGGLQTFGVNRVRLPPGAWSSQRHWHTAEDEFVFVLEGELVLISESGEVPLRAGECAAFPKDSADGHHLVNRSDAWATYLEVGSRVPTDECTYPDIDLRLGSDGRFTHKDGTPYPG